MISLRKMCQLILTISLSKIESGDMEIELSRIDICEICRESILDFYELLSNKSFQVEVDIPETSVLYTRE